MRRAAAVAAVLALLAVSVFKAAGREDRLYEGPAAARPPAPAPLVPVGCPPGFGGISCARVPMPDGGSVAIARIGGLPPGADEAPVLYLGSLFQPVDVASAERLIELAARWQRPLVLVDAPAEDPSGVHAAALSWDGLAGRIEAVRATLGIAQFAVVGVGPGAQLAEAFAARHPSRTERLVLVEAAAEAAAAPDRPGAVPMMQVNEAAGTARTGVVERGSAAGDPRRDERPGVTAVVLGASHRASLDERCVGDVIGEFLDHRAVTLAPACER